MLDNLAAQDACPLAIAPGLARLQDLRVRLPYWCEPRALQYYLRLDQPTPSNNQLREAHFHHYKHLRRQWQARLFVALRGHRPRQAVSPAALLLIRHSAGQLDWDNVYGGLKPLQDCLVQASPRNPDGLGLIADDNPRAMPFPPFVLQHDAKRGAGATELFVFALAATASPFVTI